ncbi:FmdE family protein [Dactylosporangium sp. NPDC050688]|uniref:FmdE family protein n=1 Tax=Dactylosporangium sp. NPDC050688 TaxID=3157217 RepID=UPI0033C10F5F
MTTLNERYPEIVRFHGHECPGASVGARVAEVALARFGRHDTGNEVVAVSETDACAIDAVQVLTGCTYGKRNLVHQDNGKNVFTFWRRGDATGIRVSARPGGDAYRDEATWALAEKIEAGVASPQERAAFAVAQQARTARILAAPVEELLLVEEISGDVPAVKAVRPTEPCEDCGDQTSVATLHNHRGRMVCPACHLAAHGGVLPPDHGHHGHDHAHPRAHAHAHAHAHPQSPQDNGHAHAGAHPHPHHH